MVAAKRGQHADAERLFEEARAANEQAGDEGQLAIILTNMARVALEREDDAQALGPLRRALRLARDRGSGERMTYALELASYVLHHRGRVREAATLVGAVEAVYLRLSRTQEHELPRRPLITQVVSGTGLTPLASLVPAEFDEHRVAGRSLSLERAADLALRVIDEELALVAAAGAGGSEAAGETSSISPRDGHSQAFRER
jgi:tetratricopeptide (TPR) repeat protein